MNQHIIHFGQQIESQARREHERQAVSRCTASLILEERRRTILVDAIAEKTVGDYSRLPMDFTFDIKKPNKDVTTTNTGLDILDLSIKRRADGENIG